MSALATTTGRKLAHHKFYHRIYDNTAGYTHYYGYDVGLGNTGIVWTNGGKCISGGASGTEGDLLSVPKLSDSGLTETSSAKMAMPFSTANFTLRNQANFGVHIKTYWIKTPIAQSIPAQDTINEILNSAIPGLKSINDSNFSDLTDYSDLPKYIKIVTRRKCTLMPGETKNFSLNTGFRGFRAINTTNFRTRNRLTRTIVWQVTGFPLHDQTNPLDIASAPIHIDIIGTWRAKGWIINSNNNAITKTSVGFSVDIPVGQQWQSGQPGTVWVS